jgi:hypothetical protein
MRSLKLSIAVISVTPAIAYAQPPQEPAPAVQPAEGGMPFEVVPAEESPVEDYVQKGTLQIGGSVGAAITEDTSLFTASPTVGYFVADNIEISGIFQLVYTRTEDDFGGDDSNTTGRLIVEPSYHYPVGNEVAINGNVGIGGGYDGDDINFLVIPGVGLDILTSHETVFTPTLRMPIVIGDEPGPDGGVDTNVGLALDIGISAVW